jgi:hypothetical protein
MQSKSVVYAFAAVWLFLFAASFVVVRAVAPEDDDFARRLSRIASFLTWQLGALVVAAVSAFLTQRATAHGTEGLRLPGYGPFAMSLFVLISFIGILAYRVWLQPLLAAWFGLV